MNSRGSASSPVATMPVRCVLWSSRCCLTSKNGVLENPLRFTRALRSLDLQSQRSTGFSRSTLTTVFFVLENPVFNRSSLKKYRPTCEVFRLEVHSLGFFPGSSRVVGCPRARRCDTSSDREGGVRSRKPTVMSAIEGQTRVQNPDDRTSRP
jgi:hypothetical protein